MSPVLKGIVIVIFSWLIVSVLLLGLGYFLALLLFQTRSSLRSVADHFWLGLAGLVGALQLWHFMWPVDWRCFFAFAVVGFAGLLVLVRHERRTKEDGTRAAAPSEGRAWARVAAILIGLPLLVLIANQALDLPRNIDSRMYHFQSIRWINEYPIVAGLGNLSLQLGLNQSYFLLVAFLNVFPFFGQGYHVLDSSELSSA